MSLRKRQIVLDTETTGLQYSEGHRIVEIGCVELIGRRFTENNFHFYINPERKIDEGALKVHGITQAFLSNKPRFVDIYPQLIEYLDDAELIIHNAAFDVGFLNHELKLIDPVFPKIENRCAILDTLKLARELHPGQRNSLDALCKRYSIDNSKRNFHGALLDARILAQVYLAMTSGQGSLFDTLQVPSDFKLENRKNVTNILNHCWDDLPVILATKDEQEAHQRYLAKIVEA